MIKINRETKLNDPKTGQYIEIDKAKKIGYQGHGNSYWKLYDRFNKKIGTVSKEGLWLKE